METINIENIVSMYNNENKNLKEIADTIGKAKSTIQKQITKHGYKLNTETKKYEKAMEPSSTVSNKTNISNKPVEMVNRTYAISKKLDRAMKIKSAIDGVKPIDIVRKALENYIEDKYFDM